MPPPLQRAIQTNRDDEDGARGPTGLRLLHSSPEPLVDLIFVHGLRGGSVKTWRKGDDPRMFWPQLWLPMEPGLRNVNIHSFGYESDWASTKSSILNIHDFGQSLLEEMRNSPHLRENPYAYSASSPIVLLGHSMGGLVVKKDIPDFKSRIKCIFFLATPHRGSDYAAILNNILTASGIMSSRHYCTNDTAIFSFYETLRMNLGFSSSLIVEKSSAILGIPLQLLAPIRLICMDANHRDICRFGGVDDPNYITLKNALSSAIGDLLKDVSKSSREKSKDQMKVLNAYLGISDQPDDHFPAVNGSCQWIDSRDDFQDWRDPPNEFLLEEKDGVASRWPSIFWVHANPGAGKTYLAAHIVSELQHFQLECAYHFFHIGSKSSRSLGGFLRSMAYQIATANASIRQKLWSLQEEGSSFDMDDARTIWTKVFKKGIFQVVDAIDECNKRKARIPLRIFFTSRKMPDMQRLHRPLEDSAALTCIEIPVEDSIGDIECYINTRIENLPIDTVADKQDLADRILYKSNACFLWVRLVLDELEQVYSSESIVQVLQSIPEGMMPYYERTMRAMAENKLEKHIAQAVLIWTVASARNLTIAEPSRALNLDINTVLPSAKSAVEGLCGQLVSVSNSSGLVDLVHPTAREFLMSEAAGEFREHSPLLDYAITQFSEHIYSASAETDKLLLAIDRFFRTNVLSWIERVAHKGDLHYLIRASKNLKAYLDRRAKYRSPLNSQVRNIDSWSMDLSRIVAKFGTVLLQNPSSIYFIIPPLCPSGSAVYRQFGKRPDGLTVVGFKDGAWDDCIASVNFGEDSIPAAVSCEANLIAVGMESGDINLYNHRSCQKTKTIGHKYPVDLVHLTTRYVAACTTRSVVVRDLEGNTIWENRIRFRCSLLVSSGNTLIAVSQHGHLLKWELSSGALQDDQAFSYRSHDGETEPGAFASKAPSVASISPDTEMLALGYRGGAVCLWDIQACELTSWAVDEENKLASILILISTYKTMTDMGILSASCSPDGRTLAMIDAHGKLQVWDFESLSLLYHVLSPATSFRILSFTSDGSSIVNATDPTLRIWFPATLVRKNIEEDQSVSDDAAQLTSIEGQYESMRMSRITALCPHPSLSVAFAGKYTGQVIAFNTQTGQHISVLYSHSPTAFITHLAVGKNNIIASSDVNGGLQIWKLVPGQSSVTSCSQLLTTSLFAQITQLCFSSDGFFLLVATTRSDSVYSVTDGSRIGSLPFEHHERRVCRWVQGPSQGTEEQFLLLNNHTIKAYSANNFPTTTNNSEIRLEYELATSEKEISVRFTFIYAEAQILILEIYYNSGFINKLSIKSFKNNIKKL
ncbi:NACHT and WD domain protein [Hypoxylon sp. NC1633]|nr:NACHT and WD domain protein [Hypoxylon sp. NC1633]